jgi:hypothetical protein
VLILDTVEVRWFVDARSALGRAARAAFADLVVEARWDRYLVSGRVDLSVKMRDDASRHARFEVKYLVGSLGPRRLHERAEGVVERWRKISVDARDAVTADPAWLAIGKLRRARTNRHGEDVCSAEVTEVDCELGGGGRRVDVVTVGIEAFGPGALDTLLRTAHDTFDAAPELELGAEQASSYPAWLHRIAR